MIIHIWRKIQVRFRKIQVSFNVFVLLCECQGDCGSMAEWLFMDWEIKWSITTCYNSYNASIVNELLSTLSRWFCWLGVTHWWYLSHQQSLRKCHPRVLCSEIVGGGALVLVLCIPRTCWQTRVMVESSESYHAFPILPLMIQNTRRSW